MLEFLGFVLDVLASTSCVVLNGLPNEVIFLMPALCIDSGIGIAVIFVHCQQDGTALGKAFDVSQPVFRFLGERLGIIPVGNHHHIETASGEEAAVHGVHDLLTSEIPKTNAHSRIVIFCGEGANINAVRGLRPFHQMFSLAQNAQNSMGFACFPMP